MEKISIPHPPDQPSSAVSSESSYDYNMLTPGDGLSPDIGGTYWPFSSGDMEAKGTFGEASNQVLKKTHSVWRNEGKTAYEQFVFNF
jgi:hypothetical protein